MPKIACIDIDNPYGFAPGGQSTFTKDFLLPIYEGSLLITAGNVPKNTSIVSILESSRSKRLDSLRFSNAARRFVKNDNSFDLIFEQFTSPIGPAGLPAITATPIIGVACFSFWDEMTKKYHLPFSTIAHRRLREYKYLVADHTSVSKRLSKINPAAKIIVVDQMVRTNFEFNQTPGSKALFIGRPDTYQKGLDLLLDAIERIRTPEFELEIGGFEEDNYHWQKLIKGRQLKCRVKFLGYLDDEKRAEAYKRAYVLLAPSRYEGTGYILAEAAHCGVPVVAFDIDSFKDRKSFIFSAQEMSGDALANKIDESYSNTAEYKEKRHACKMFRERENKNNGLANLRELINEVMTDL